MPTYSVQVFYTDSNVPGKRLTRTIILEADNETTAKNHGETLVISEVARDKYNGNIAFFSNVSSEIVPTLHGEWEIPSKRDDRGKPRKLLI